MKLVQEVVRTVRSMKQDYLPPKARPEGKERVKDAKLEATCKL